MTAKEISEQIKRLSQTINEIKKDLKEGYIKDAYLATTEIKAINETIRQALVDRLE